jgi:hypothetical protein
MRFAEFWILASGGDFVFVCECVCVPLPCDGIASRMPVFSRALFRSVLFFAFEYNAMILKSTPEFDL